MLKLCSKISCCIFTLIKKYALTFIAGLVFALLCFVAINLAMAPVSKSSYCGSSCHEMNTAYQTWELSPHGSNKYGIRVECVSCHMPPKDKYFTHLVTKAYYGAKDTYKHHCGPEYDVQQLRNKVKDHMSNEPCLYCHNDLLKKPGGSAARIAAIIVLRFSSPELATCE